MFRETHPIIGTRDIRQAIEFYTQKLGFKLVFEDAADPPNYVVFRRDAVELHMQFQFEYEMAPIRLRFLVRIRTRSLTNTSNAVLNAPHGIRDTSWGTRE